MKKITAVSVLLLSAVLAIACGGGGGDSNARAITGTVDSSVLSAANAASGEYEVWAMLKGEYLKKGTLTPGSSGEDSTYAIDGLSNGTDYTVALVRVSGFTKTPVLQTVITANDSSGSLSKAGREKVRRKRQMNVATTYVAQRYAAAVAAGTSVTVTSVTTAVFGSSVSLDNIVMDKGAMTNSSGTGITFADPVARAAVTQLTVVTAVSVTMSSSALASNASAIASFISAVSSATSLSSIVSQSAGSLSTLVNTVIAASSASAFSTVLAAVDTYTAAALGGGSIATTIANMSVTTLTVASFAVETMVATVTGATISSTYISTLSTASGISTASIQTQTSTLVSTVGAAAGLTTSQISTAQASAGGTVTITSFELAHAAYGTKSGDDFSLNTLAPVFKVVLDTALTASTFSDYVTVSLQGGSTSVTNSSLTSDTLVRTVTSTDGKTIFLMVKKAASVDITAKSELSPGGSYSYTITPVTGKTLVMSGKSFPLSGKITVKNITFTYPITSSTADSLVNLGVSTFTGLSSTTPTFVVHSKKAMDQFSATATGYGVLSYMTITTKKAGSTISALNTGSNFTLASATSTGFVATVKSSAGLSSGSQYTLTVAAKSGFTVGNGTAVTSSDLPGDQTMDLK